MKTSEENTKKLLTAKETLLKKINDVEIAKEIIKTKISNQAKQSKSPTVSPKRYIFSLFFYRKTKNQRKFPLAPMGVLAPGSAHARPSA